MQKKKLKCFNLVCLFTNVLSNIISVFALLRLHALNYAAMFNNLPEKIVKQHAMGKDKQK